MINKLLKEKNNLLKFNLLKAINMSLFIIHPIDEAQEKALQLILDGLKIPYDQEPEMDATEYLTSTEANKKSLDASIEEHNRGEGVKINLEDIWK